MRRHVLLLAMLLLSANVTACISPLGTPSPNEEEEPPNPDPDDPRTFTPGEAPFPVERGGAFFFPGT